MIENVQGHLKEGKESDDENMQVDEDKIDEMEVSENMVNLKRKVEKIGSHLTTVQIDLHQTLNTL